MAKNDDTRSDMLRQTEQNIEAMLERLSLSSAKVHGVQKERQQLQALLDKIRQKAIYIVVYGRVSVGKSSLLNALIGEDVFSTSVLHGETKTTEPHLWRSHQQHNVTFIDTPGIDEVNDSERAQLARETLNSADIILFVVDADLTQQEYDAAISAAQLMRPIVFVINKADRYDATEIDRLLTHMRTRLNHGLLEAGLAALKSEMFIPAKAIATEEIIYRETSPGQYKEEVHQHGQDIAVVQDALLQILEHDAQSLSSLSASLFMCQLNQQHIEAIAEQEQVNAKRLIRQHCVYKSLAVALNPLPVVDMAAAAGVDIMMVMQLSKLYGVSMSHRQANKLVLSIAAQMAVLYGSFWLVHLAASGLKFGSFGLSTLATGVSQGAIAWYSTLLIGEVAKAYIKNGHSWGEYGAKLTIEGILSEIDKKSIINDAKSSIRDYIKQ